MVKLRIGQSWSWRKGASLSNYHTITCLSITGEFLSASIAAEMNGHMAQYMSETKKGISKDTESAKHQLLFGLITHGAELGFWGLKKRRVCELVWRVRKGGMPDNALVGGEGYLVFSSEPVKRWQNVKLSNTASHYFCVAVKFCITSMTTSVL